MKIKLNPTAGKVLTLTALVLLATAAGATQLSAQAGEEVKSETSVSGIEWQRFNAPQDAEGTIAQDTQTSSATQIIESDMVSESVPAAPAQSLEEAALAQEKSMALADVEFAPDSEDQDAESEPVLLSDDELVAPILSGPRNYFEPMNIDATQTQSVTQAKRVTSFEFNNKSDLNLLGIPKRHTGGHFNNEVQLYKSDNVNIVGGALRIDTKFHRRAIKIVDSDYFEWQDNKPGGKTNWSSGIAYFPENFSLKPGETMSVRAKFDLESGVNPKNLNGAWPSFWAADWAPQKSSNGTTLYHPYAGEVDLIEAKMGETGAWSKAPSTRNSITVHYANRKGVHQLPRKDVYLKKNGAWSTDSGVRKQLLSDGEYHLYQMKYGKKGDLEFVIDGKSMWKMKVPNRKSYGKNPFRQAITGWRVNLAVGGDFNQKINSKAVEALSYSIDYVRVAPTK